MRCIINEEKSRMFRTHVTREIILFTKLLLWREIETQLVNVDGSK